MPKAIVRNMRSLLVGRRVWAGTCRRERDSL
jgi:hypothetical protein